MKRFAVSPVVASPAARALVVLIAVSVGAAAAAPPPAATQGAADGETAAIESLYRVEHWPRLLPGVAAKMFSSYDRTGGNDDGFSGAYSRLRIENGNSVLAEMTGPGCIQRIHLPHSGYQNPGLLRRKGEHIRIFLDGSDKPALDVPLEDLFSGKVEGFPKPLVGEGFGGHYCYVPIPYRNGCRVETEGTFGRFYAVAYRTCPSADGIVTFQNPPTPRQRAALAAAVRAWTSCGEIPSCETSRLQRTEQPLELKAGESFAKALPAGPGMVRAVYLECDPASRDAAGAVRLRIRWDGAAAPAVDAPLDFFFCQAMQPGAFRSLLVGTNEQGWYNFMPMPYRESASLELVASKPFKGRVTVLTEPLGKGHGDLGYLHAEYHESLPTERGKCHLFLDRQGHGHYAGTYLATDGHHPSGLPSWLEGDELFTCDGELRIHGTGTEDYFNCGWYGVAGRLDGPCAFPLHGFSVYRGKDKRSEAAAFRWNVPAPVPYDKSLRAEIEHGPGNDVQVNYRSTAFFYDAAPW